MESVSKERIEELVDYIMKKCLWQFHSRAWDREKQNEGILTKTKQLLCGEEVDLSTPNDKVFWVDAVCLADAFKSRCPWLEAMDKDEIKLLMQGLKDRMDYLTITGSLNEELKDAHY
ncbi:Fe-only nitrogenase subunit delta [Sporomusa sp.]|uniref:Fe-only nitrogenase subunit delta n=1 Tax=Sporomusa sp. TaxID=2078658 RepID=UPI002BBDD814|nr:Fe-only nitrogenase subunit delta [Sporomusa sp.]HWR07873.1 Fe-only nitrogenase subunit delta [Sporomusa sp.]